MRGAPVPPVVLRDVNPSTLMANVHIGRLPLTGRSSNSSLNLNETPRTAGGNYERGTPRDPQRLALGERPQIHREIPSAAHRDVGDGTGGLQSGRLYFEANGGLIGAGGYPASSPQHTARSQTLSSEPWSMTPTSQGDTLSSRSHSITTEDAAYFNVPSTLQFGTPRGALHLNAAQGEDAAKQCVELSRSLEVMRFHVMRENAKLKEQLQQMQTVMREMSEHCLRPSPGPSHVEWLLQNVDRSRYRAEGDAEPCTSSERTGCKLREHPGVEFKLEFQPVSRRDGALCELLADITGPACEGLRLYLRLTIEIGETSSSCAACVHGRSQLRCTHSWPVCGEASIPAGTAATYSATSIGTGKCSVLCRLEVEDVTWGPGKLCLSTVGG